MGPEGVPQDLIKAKMCFMQIATADDEDDDMERDELRSLQGHAMYNLGSFFCNGEGVARDISQARAWFERAVELGDEAASLSLRMLDGVPGAEQELYEFMSSQQQQ